MKILHVVQAYYPFQEKGGPVFKVRSLAETMVRHGHQATVLTADLGLNRYPDLASSLAPSAFGKSLNLAGVEVIYLPTLAHYRAVTLNPRAVEFCETQLREFHVIHFYGLYDLLGPTIGYFGRRRQIPYVVEPMGMYRPIDRNLRMKRMWHRTLGHSLLQGAARLVATSEIERQELLEAKFPTEKIVLRYNGIDSPAASSSYAPGTFRAKWKLPSGEPLILFLSRLIPRKGADLLIEAFAQACPDQGRLVIAGPEGEAGYRSYLESCAAKSGVRERIIFTGPVYDDEKNALYRDADVFVLPSRYENFANVAAEAMAFGVPVILSDRCGVSELVRKEQAGLVVPVETNEVAAAIGSVLSDRDQYRRFQAGCTHLVEGLGWDHLTRQMEDCYEIIAKKYLQTTEP
jgi:glycosyltransferase involved in cell wall biosynthesis